MLEYWTQHLLLIQCNYIENSKQWWKNYIQASPKGRHQKFEPLATFISDNTKPAKFYRLRPSMAFIYFREDVCFFTWNIKGRVCYFELFKGGFCIKGRVTLMDNNLRGDLSHLCDKNEINSQKLLSTVQNEFWDKFRYWDV